MPTVLNLRPPNLILKDMDVVRLDQLRKGERGTIHSLDGGFEQNTQLMELGVTVGAAIEFIKLAPLGDPIEIKIRGYHLSIRREMAKLIFVQI